MLQGLANGSLHKPLWPWLRPPEPGNGICLTVLGQTGRQIDAWSLVSSQPILLCELISHTVKDVSCDWGTIPGYILGPLCSGSHVCTCSITNVCKHVNGTVALLPTWYNKIIGVFNSFFLYNFFLTVQILTEILFPMCRGFWCSLFHHFLCYT